MNAHKLPPEKARAFAELLNFYLGEIQVINSALTGEFEAEGMMVGEMFPTHVAQEVLGTLTELARETA